MQVALVAVLAGVMLAVIEARAAVGDGQRRGRAAGVGSARLGRPGSPATTWCRWGRSPCSGWCCWSRWPRPAERVAGGWSGSPSSPSGSPWSPGPWTAPPGCAPRRSSGAERGLLEGPGRHRAPGGHPLGRPGAGRDRRAAAGRRRGRDDPARPPLAGPRRRLPRPARPRPASPRPGRAAMGRRLTRIFTVSNLPAARPEPASAMLASARRRRGTG